MLQCLMELRNSEGMQQVRHSLADRLQSRAGTPPILVRYAAGKHLAFENRCH